MTSISKSEAAYIAGALLATPTPTRADGRTLLDYRAISVETGVAPAANGSGRAVIGAVGNDATEIVAAVRLEVEDLSSEDGDKPFSCSVTCTPSAYPSLTPPQLDDLSTDLSIILSDALITSIHTHVAPQLVITPNGKRWHISLEAVITSDSGNVIDALVIASRTAFWNLRIPRTRSVEYRKTFQQDDGGLTMDVDQPSSTGDAFKSAVGKGVRKYDGGSGKGAVGRKGGGADFELEDYWDDGVPLKNREALPVCVTLNLLPPIHFLDATTLEGESVPTKLHLVFSFPSPTECFIQNTRMTGPDEVPLKALPDLIKAGQSYASKLATALTTQLSAE
ncbi:hypothetical protein FRB96_006777 [Tulasnella sp. 330]|nr:hypothetical protein FRB96_006777 [Tulasnella sp. 330]KAG8869934.1 hypothetical protein FRB97_000625 [Tulasnella sp. 331]